MKHKNRKNAVFVTAIVMIAMGLFFLSIVSGSNIEGRSLIFAQTLQGKDSSSGSNGNDDVTVRILIAKSADEVSISAPGGIKFSPGEKQVGVSLFSSDDHVFKLKDDAISLKTKDKNEQTGSWQEVTISPSQADTPLKVGKNRYRGKIKLSVSKKNILVINILPLEQYLYGVVPEELGSSSIEANKAQAVVARTFALGHLGICEKYGYDFSSGTSYQVYGGLDQEQPLCNKAVDDTKGIVLASGGKPVKYPLYHSTCGGTTTDNETVFLTNPIPYLRSVVCDDKLDGAPSKINGDQTPPSPSPSPSPSVSPSPSTYRGPGFLNDDAPTPSPQATATPSATPSVSPSPSPAPAAAPRVVLGSGKVPVFVQGNTINFDVPPANCSMSSYYRWEVRWSNEELSQIIDKAYIEDDTGTIKDLVVEKRGPDGRVSILKIVTDKGEFRVRGDEIRPTFKFKAQNGAMRNLYSSRFNISKSVQNGETTWVFKGSGWGHGAGMCQFGALGLAKKGYRYDQILKKYYKGVELVDYHKINGVIPTPVKTR
ncbi:MAG: SpoIID/LytB domain-containing protein [Firmicutes bacterium]|nr:SpoIID/LytB domain-containing protein [Bacillota bacterium]